MNVLDSLADTLERESAPPDALARLDGDIQALLALDPGEREAAALTLLQSWVAECQRRILLLLDLMTPLYKARMEHLAEQPRKLLAHLMEHWAPIGTGDLGRASGIPATTVSGQLIRLEAEGLVEKTPLAGTRRSGYQVSERFFNVWYLMPSAWVRC